MTFNSSRKTDTKLLTALLVVVYFNLTGCVSFFEQPPTTTPTTTPKLSSFQKHGLYIWEEAEGILLNEKQWNEFFRRMESWEVQTIYLSWGTVSKLQDSLLRSFLYSAHSRDFRIEALIGTQGLEGLRRAEIELDHLRSFQNTAESRNRFDGVHLDLEPGDDNVASFFDEYHQLVRSMARHPDFNQSSPTSLAVAWWWREKSNQTWRKLVEQNHVQYIVVMAYFNSPDEIVERTEQATKSTEIPVVIALEADRGLTLSSDGSPSGEYTPERIESAVQRRGSKRLQSVFQGLAFHHYQELR